MSSDLELAAKASVDLEPAVEEFIQATGILAPIQELTAWAADAIRYRRAPHTARLLIKTAEKVKATGLPPSAVSDGILRAVLQDGPFADEEDMTDRWANLLAREVTGERIPPAFPEILKQLEPAEARALDSLVSRDGHSPSINVGTLGLELSQFENLERLALVKRITESDEPMPAQLAERFPDHASATALGTAFVTACRSPAGMPDRPSASSAATEAGGTPRQPSRDREVQAALRQIRTEVRQIGYLATKVGGLPVRQAATDERFPDLERGKHYQLLAHELPGELYDEMEHVYEIAHQIRTDVDRRARYGDTADVEHAHAARLEQLGRLAPELEERLRAYEARLDNS